MEEDFLIPGLQGPPERDFEGGSMIAGDDSDPWNFLTGIQGDLQFTSTPYIRSGENRGYSNELSTGYDSSVDVYQDTLPYFNAASLPNRGHSNIEPEQGWTGHFEQIHLDSRFQGHGSESQVDSGEKGVPERHGNMDAIKQEIISTAPADKDDYSSGIHKRVDFLLGPGRMAQQHSSLSRQERGLTEEGIGRRAPQLPSQHLPPQQPVTHQPSPLPRQERWLAGDETGGGSHQLPSQHLPPQQPVTHQPSPLPRQERWLAGDETGGGSHQLLSHHRPPHQPGRYQHSSLPWQERGWAGEEAGRGAPQLPLNHLHPHQPGARQYVSSLGEKGGYEMQARPPAYQAQSLEEEGRSTIPGWQPSHMGGYQASGYSVNPSPYYEARREEGMNMPPHRSAARHPNPYREGSINNPSPSSPRTELRTSTVGASAKQKKPAYYNGKGSWLDYLVQFELIAEINRWDASTKALELATSLRDSAQGVLADLDDVERREYDCLVDALTSRFEPPNFAEVLGRNLKADVGTRMRN